VLVDFWTYSCINCIRTLPYLQAWHERYANEGLVILGVHAPEFSFERKIENVRKAVEDFGLTYPVVQDNEKTLWNLYHNRYWPAKYFIDKAGHIRHIDIGEGRYEQQEEIIQALLAEQVSS
jgi:thiol-disulfide isomerase/thioredoxin